MTSDLKRELLRHLLAALVFRAGIALRGAPAGFAAFRIDEAVRTPAEILAHLGDLLEGSLYLLRGELVYLNSAPLAWDAETERFFAAARQLDAFLASAEPLAESVERLVQAPVADAFTHVGQLVMLRRLARAPVETGNYFAAEIVAGKFEK